MIVLMGRDCTGLGMRLATDIGITTDYGRRMTARSMPPLWETVCRAVGLPAGASIDKVLDAYGHAVGRGTLQRIRDGESPRMSSLQKLAEAVGLDDWSRLASPSDGGGSPAGSFDEPPAHQHPPLVSWEVIVQKKGQLPHRFRCEVPDDALWSSTEGGTPKGTPVVFVASSTPPPTAAAQPAACGLFSRSRVHP